MGKKKTEKLDRGDPVVSTAANPEKERKRKSRILLIIDVCSLVIGLICLALLLWLRIDWGFREWIHQLTFYNFWIGAYVMIAATIVLCCNCSLGIWSVVRRSIKGIVVHFVFHGVTIVLILIGAAAMLSDAFGTEVVWIHRMIIDLMDPSNYNSNYYKDQYLGTMSRIVRCCGADGHEDYSNLFNISPPEECIDARHAGGLYYKRGCAEAFSVWLKAWAGSISGVMIVVALFEIYAIYLCVKLLKLYKRRTVAPIQQEFHYPDLPPTPPERSTSARKPPVPVHFGANSEKVVTTKQQVQHAPTPPPAVRRTQREQTQTGEVKGSPAPKRLASPGLQRKTSFGSLFAITPPKPMDSRGSFSSRSPAAQRKSSSIGNLFAGPRRTKSRERLSMAGSNSSQSDDGDTARIVGRRHSSIRWRSRDDLILTNNRSRSRSSISSSFSDDSMVKENTRRQPANNRDRKRSKPTPPSTRRSHKEMTHTVKVTGSPAPRRLQASSAAVPQSMPPKKSSFGSLFAIAPPKPVQSRSKENLSKSPAAPRKSTSFGSLFALSAPKGKSRERLQSSGSEEEDMGGRKQRRRRRSSIRWRSKDDLIVSESRGRSSSSSSDDCREDQQPFKRGRRRSQSRDSLSQNRHRSSSRSNLLEQNDDAKRSKSGGGGDSSLRGSERSNFQRSAFLRDEQQQQNAARSSVRSILSTSKSNLQNGDAPRTDGPLQRAPKKQSAMKPGSNSSSGDSLLSSVIQKKRTTPNSSQHSTIIKAPRILKQPEKGGKDSLLLLRDDDHQYEEPKLPTSSSSSSSLSSEEQVAAVKSVSSPPPPLPPRLESKVLQNGKKMEKKKQTKILHFPAFLPKSKLVVAPPPDSPSATSQDSGRTSSSVRSHIRDGNTLFETSL